ncbi:hypothetical protein [Brevibacillus antibioticus]|nr:hypothetical protein [Brevibacillus antibioticus]
MKKWLSGLMVFAFIFTLSNVHGASQNVDPDWKRVIIATVDPDW